MKPVSSLVIVTLAAALAACASQTPAPAAASGASPGSSLVAASSTEPQATSKLPHGYKLTMMNGEEMYCRNDLVMGSRARRQQVCITKDQMQELQTKGSDYIYQVQRAGTTMTAPSTPGAGGAMGGR